MIKPGDYITFYYNGDATDEMVGKVLEIEKMKPTSSRIEAPEQYKVLVLAADLNYEVHIEVEYNPNSKSLFQDIYDNDMLVDTNEIRPMHLNLLKTYCNWAKQKHDFFKKAVKEKE